MRYKVGTNVPQKQSTFLINAISVVIPLVVVLLLTLPNKANFGAWTKNLPHVIGTVNTVASVVLIFGLIFIKLNRENLHRYAMTTAFSLGVVFLVCYVTYHLTNPSNKFNGEGFVRYFYLGVLLTHVLLSLIVLPLVLRAMYFAITKQFAKHKRIVKYAYPIWLYVSVTGVIVYLMRYHLFPVPLT